MALTDSRQARVFMSQKSRILFNVAHRGLYLLALSIDAVNLTMERTDKARF